MKEEKVSRLQTLLLALLLNLNSIPAAVGINGTFIAVLIVCYILVFVSHAFKINTGYWLVIIANIICAISIFLAPDGNNPRAEQYLLYGLSVGMFIFFTRIHFDSNKLFRYVITIGLILAPLHLLRAIALSKAIGIDVDTGVMMGLSYAIMPSFLCSLLMLFRDEKLFWKILSFILFSSGLYIYMLIGSRGCYVVIIGFILLYIVNKKFKSIKSRIVTVITIAIIGNVIMNNFILVFEWLANVLSRLGIEVYAIQKMLFYYSIDKADNGRNELSDIAWKGIEESPFGHYIGSFELANDTYTHNLFLQMTWDYGIIGFIFISIIYIKSLNYFICLDSNDRNHDVCFVIFSSSMIMLLFSSTYWLLPCFWLWLKFILKNKKDATNTLYRNLL